MNVAVLKQPDAEWERAERALEERGIPLPVQARAAWVRSLREPVWLLVLRDGRGDPAWGGPISATRSRALPGSWILRVLRFGHGIPPELVARAAEALQQLARSEGALRLHAELYAPEPQLRGALAAALARAGFAPAAPRMYEQTILIDLAPAEDALFATLHATGRRHVRALAKHGLECAVVTEPALAARMGELVAETFARTGEATVEADWAGWLKLAADRPDLARIIGVFTPEPRALTGFVLGCRHGDTVEYHVAASTRPAGSNVPLLYAPTWELIRWARSAGATTFDFGGVTGSTADGDDPRGGISDFKRYFSRNVADVGGEFRFAPSRWRSAAAAAVTGAAALVRHRRR